MQPLLTRSKLQPLLRARVPPEGRGALRLPSSGSRRLVGGPPVNSLLTTNHSLRGFGPFLLTAMDQGFAVFWKNPPLLHQVIYGALVTRQVVFGA
jgi:hypothetical protein